MTATRGGKSHQQRSLTEACKRAKIKPAVRFHDLRHTHGSALATKGVPLAVIAAAWAADTRLTERQYAHLSPNYVADTIRANFATLDIVPRSNVRSLGKRQVRLTLWQCLSILCANELPAMTDETANLILEHLKAIRGKVDTIALDVADLKSRVQTLGSHMATMVSAMAAYNLRLDHVAERVARIERRLELAH